MLVTEGGFSSAFVDVTDSTGGPFVSFTTAGLIPALSTGDVKSSVIVAELFAVLPERVRRRDPDGRRSSRLAPRHR